jgi:hypothetical protein
MATTSFAVPGSSLADMTPEAKTVEFINACKTGRFGMAKALLVTKNASVRARDATGWSPLLWASFNGHHRIVDLLLQHEAAEDWREEFAIEDMLETTQATDDEAMAETSETAPFKPVNSPLHWAVYRGHLRVAWILIRSGFSTMDVDDRGNTALHLAAMNGDGEIVRSVMMAGVQVRQLNLNGNDPLAVASSDAARTLLKHAAEQRMCPGSRNEFGPRQPQYLCFSTNQFFSDEASNQMDVAAFASERGVKRPVRVSNKREYEIQDAETALFTALNTHGVLDNDDVLGGAQAFEFEAGNGAGATGIEDDEATPGEASGRSSAGGFASGAASGAGAASVAGGGAGGEPPSVGDGGRGSSPAGALDGAMHKGMGLGVAAIVEEGEDEDEEEEDDEAGGEDSRGLGSARDSEHKGDSLGEIAAAADAAPEFPPWPADRDERLEAAELEPLRRATEAVKAVNGSVWLVARAERALVRVAAWAECEKEAETVTRQRPLRRVSETKTLRACIRRARDAGVEGRLDRIGSVVRTAEVECLVRDVEAVCSTIPLATHDFDADLKRLSSSLDELESLDSRSTVLGSARTLSSRLAVEVELSDSVSELESTVSAARKTFEEFRDEDPTSLPLPEPTPEEIEAKRLEEEAAAAAKEAKSKQRPGKAAAAEPEEEEEPLPPLYPSPQLQATEHIEVSAEVVRAAVVRATEAGADAALIEKTSASVDAILQQRQEMWEEEIARIRVFEADRIKREKKKKKGKKGKKKK